MVVRTRFAPSPTGDLHLGSARTALFAWAYARRHGGQFILRIEDTDRERSSQASIDVILQGMQWLELEYDEGPFYQTQRFDRYRAVIQQLLAKGHAYRCHCSKARLEALRAEQLANKQKPRYDGHCREANLGAESNDCVVRFCNPSVGVVRFIDQVHGVIEVANSELDDLIIERSDGTPTYNLSVVVDDIDMQITHVIRGDDHINNTPRQINLLLALEQAIPHYAHLPMILGADGARLSKRHGAASVLQYRDEGYLPQAFLNYLLRLGWSHGDQEIFSRQEMIALFDIAAVNKSAASINPDKLLWLNQHYLKTNAVSTVADALAWHMQQQGVDVNAGPSLVEVVRMQAERCKTLTEMVQKSSYFYQEPASYDEKAAEKNLLPELIPALKQVLADYQCLSPWLAEPIHQVILQIAAQFDIKLGKLAQAIRVAMTGNTVSPPLDVTLQAIGQARVLQRLQRALAYMQERTGC